MSTSKEKNHTPDLSVVIPLYNEEESVAELYAQISAVVEREGLDTEIIFIDDGSTDDSFEVLCALREQDPRVRVCQFRRNYGKSAALAEGFARARGAYVVTMDADLQDDPEEIPHLIDKLEQGFDLISGWKKKRYDPFIKRVTSKLFNFVTRTLTGVNLHDMNCGLKIYRNEVVKNVQIYGQRHRFIPVLAVQNGFRVGELVVTHHARKYGVSKFGPSRFLNGFLDLITLIFLSRYVKRPLHFFGGVGMILLFLGFLISLDLTIERIFFQRYLTNRPLLFLGVLLIIVGTQFISIGLIGEMFAESRAENRQYKIRASLGFDDDEE
ncbi:MAG TPA: glycosyltransferase [Bacteroidetes bacterium]|nr:glycosyltransferase [Bacteroidota bacterium]